MLHAHSQLGSKDFGILIDADDQVEELVVKGQVRSVLKHEHLLQYCCLLLEGGNRLCRVEHPFFNHTKDLLAKHVVLRSFDKRGKDTQIRPALLSESCNAS